MMKSGLTIGLKNVKAEFVLAKLESNDGSREILTGQVGMLGYNGGIREEDQMKITITKMDNGIYKVVSAKNLKASEYGFINATFGVSVLANGVRLWDFGVER